MEAWHRFSETIHCPAPKTGHSENQESQDPTSLRSSNSLKMTSEVRGSGTLPCLGPQGQRETGSCLDLPALVARTFTVSSNCSVTIGELAGTDESKEKQRTLSTRANQ